MSDFKDIKNDKDWERFKNESKSKSLALLKHSDTCPISKEVHRDIMNAQGMGILKHPVYVLKIQDSRELSDRVSKELQVTHQTPQVIIVRNEKAVYNASQEDINPGELLEYLNNYEK